MSHTFHGGLPERHTDHGVFSDSQQSANVMAQPDMTVERVSARIQSVKVQELTSRKQWLDEQVGELIDRVKAGSTDPDDAVNLTTLSAELRSVVDQLTAAQRELEVEEQKARHADHDARRKRFEETLIRAHSERIAFQQLFRDACLALGQLCSTVDEAVALANSLTTPLGMMPLDQAHVREISQDPNPLPALLDSGHKTTQKFGWNLRIAIVPLRKRS